MKALSFGRRARRRRPSLTPMIDVVFLLLVFFMLAARFGTEQALSVGAALTGGGDYRGAPRLVTVAPGDVRLNGRTLDPAALPDALRPLMPDAQALVVLRAVEGADLQAVVRVLDALDAAGIGHVVLAE